jgi:hypothetical protein
MSENPKKLLVWVFKHARLCRTPAAGTIWGRQSGTQFDIKLPYTELCVTLPVLCHIPVWVGWASTHQIGAFSLLVTLAVRAVEVSKRKRVAQDS